MNVNALLPEPQVLSASKRDWQSVDRLMCALNPSLGNINRDGSEHVPSQWVGLAKQSDHLFRAVPAAPVGEGSLSRFIARTELSVETNNRFEQDRKALQGAYILRNKELVFRFLSSHPSLVSALLAALPNLRRCFGDDVVLHLEVLVEEADGQSLYAIVMWRGAAEHAERSLENFDECWGLSQPHRGLTFTYELV